LKINLNFSFETRLGIPKIRIGIGNQVLYDGDVKETIYMEKQLPQGSHSFYIEHYGKTRSEASVEGIDKHVLIEKISFDNVNLDQQLWDGKFFPAYLHNAHNEPEYIQPNLYLGHNGKWIYNFEYPFVVWVIKKRNLGPKLKNTIFQTDQENLSEAKKWFENIEDI
jgi:hypothetical protein